MLILFYNKSSLLSFHVFVLQEQVLCVFDASLLFHLNFKQVRSFLRITTPTLNLYLTQKMCNKGKKARKWTNLCQHPSGKTITYKKISMQTCSSFWNEDAPLSGWPWKYGVDRIINKYQCCGYLGVTSLDQEHYKLIISIQNICVNGKQNFILSYIFQYLIIRHH